jgi:large conductance mechanosensitive channel
MRGTFFQAMTMHFWRDFRKFVTRGNLVDLAVGFTVGAAFTTIARSLVDDIIMPPVGLLMGRTDFKDFFIVLREGPNVAPPYLTLAQAKAAGAVTLNYGMFINAMFAFLLVGLAMFVVSRLMSRAEAKMDAHFQEPPPPPGEPTEKKCPYCRSIIPIKACRCPQCTSHLTVPDEPDNPSPAPDGKDKQAA